MDNKELTLNRFEESTYRDQYDIEHPCHILVETKTFREISRKPYIYYGHNAGDIITYKARDGETVRIYPATDYGPNEKRYLRVNEIDKPMAVWYPQNKKPYGVKVIIDEEGNKVL